MGGEGGKKPVGKGVAGGGTTSEGGQWEMPGWSRGNVSWLLLSSGSALGISSAAAFAFSRGTGPGGEAGTCHPGGGHWGASGHVGAEQPAPLPMSCVPWNTHGTGAPGELQGQQAAGQYNLSEWLRTTCGSLCLWESPKGTFTLACGAYLTYTVKKLWGLSTSQCC